MYTCKMMPFMCTLLQQLNMYNVGLQHVYNKDNMDTRP